MKFALLALAAVSLAALPARADWSQGAPLETPVHGAAAAAADGAVYLGGGDGLLEPRSAFSMLEDGAEAWIALEPMPVGLTAHAMAALDGEIYVAGGFRKGFEEPSASVWIYNIAEKRWRDGPAMPIGRRSFTLTALDGQLYATGADRLIAFDPDEGMWRDLGPEPIPSRTAAAAVLDGKLWLIGGGSREPKLTVEGAPDTAVEARGGRVDVYDPATETWSRGPDLPVARFGHVAVVSDGALHVVGGRDAYGETLSDHLVLEDGAWAASDPLPAPRAGSAAAALPGGRFIVAGGGFAGGFFASFTAVDSVEIFTPAGR